MTYLKNVATLRLTPDNCTGCGRCVEVCPREVFSLTGRKAAITVLDRCIECGACARNCAFDALKVDAGVGCAEALFRAMVTGGEPVCGCGDGEESKGSTCC